MKNRLFLLLLSALLLLPPMAVGQTAASAKKKKKNVVRYGIDVSHHNGKIDWKKVPKSVQFVYIKATEGASLQDDRYATNLKQARQQGFKVGSYHFFHMTTGARAQFNNFKKVVKKSQQDLIPMVDVETLDRKSPKQLRDSLSVFCKLCEKHYGKKPIIYTSESHYNNWLAPHFNKYHLYIARYMPQAPQITGPGTYTIWQYSEKGTVKGINHKVDLAKFNPKYSVWSILL